MMMFTANILYKSFYMLSTATVKISTYENTETNVVLFQGLVSSASVSKCLVFKAYYVHT